MSTPTSSRSTLWHSVGATLDRWSPSDSNDESLRHTMLAFLHSNADACLRANEAGHFTASSLVLNESGTHVLLTLHPKVGRWIQLGGHCEPTDHTVTDAALREAREESGIADLILDPELLSAHTHPITCSLGKATRHLDLRFLVRAPDGARAVRSEESTDLRWWPVNALPDAAEHETIDHLVALAARR